MVVLADQRRRSIHRRFGMDRFGERQVKLAVKASSTIFWDVDDFSIGLVETVDCAGDSDADLFEAAHQEEEEEEKRVCPGVGSVSVELEGREEVEEVDQVVEVRWARCPRRRRMNKMPV